MAKRGRCPVAPAYLQRMRRSPHASQAGTVARVTGQIYDAYDVGGLPLPMPDDLRKGVILLESSRTGPP